MIPHLQSGQNNASLHSTKSANIDNLVYGSEVMEHISKLIDRVSNTEANVLITGASGTGKELVARKIHQTGYRKNKPFVIVHCSYLQNNESVESELFGQEKTEITNQVKKGLLEQANGGTIVFDEVGDLSLDIQTKLQKFTEDKVIYRVKGKTPVHLNVRIICTSRKNLGDLVLKSQFREGLFYRINTINMTLPALSDRINDIPILLNHFLKGNIQIEPEAMEVLLKYPWRGNVRELKNLCERLRVINTNNVIDKSHIPEELLNYVSNPRGGNVDYNPNITLQELNKHYILNAIEYFASKRDAAKALGITVKTLYNRMHEYGVFEKYAIHSPLFTTTRAGRPPKAKKSHPEREFSQPL